MADANLSLAIGARVRELRGRRPQQAVAEAAQISQPYLSRIESDEHFPSGPILARLAHALGVPPAELLTATSSSAPEPTQVAS